MKRLKEEGKQAKETLKSVMVCPLNTPNYSKHCVCKI